MQYRGTPAAVTDFVAGRVDFVIDSQTLLAPLVRDGRARGLAVTTARRSQLLPDLPTLQEAGVAGYAASSCQPLYAPRGSTSEPLPTRSTALIPAPHAPATRPRLALSGSIPLPD